MQLTISSFVKGLISVKLILNVYSEDLLYFVRDIDTLDTISGSQYPTVARSKVTLRMSFDSYNFQLINIIFKISKLLKKITVY